MAEDRIVGYFMKNGKPHSAKTGKELKSVDDRKGTRYIQVNPLPDDYFSNIAKRANTVRLEGITSARSAVIPNFGEYVAKTRKNKTRTIGTAKDSYLGALNTSYAILEGIPLNKENRKILNRVYMEEVKSALPNIAPIMARHKDDWVSSKSKKYWQEPFSSESKKDAMAVRSSRKAYKARQELYGNVRMHEGLRNPFA